MSRVLAIMAALVLCSWDAGRIAMAENDAQASPQRRLYRVQLNGQDVGDALLLRTSEGRLLLSEDGWRYWRLQLPNTPPILLDGERHWALDAARGFEVTLDDAAQQAQIHFAPSAFARSVIRAGNPAAPLAQRPNGVGGFLNYEAVATRNWNDRTDDSSELNGQIETGIFSPLGVGIGQWVGLDLGGEQKILRLDSFWRIDDPQRITSLQIGDAIGRAGMWGRAVRFGGLQWSRNFSTQPNFISLPQPVVNGESSLPSVLEVYVDGIRRQTLSVPQGPFSIDNIPAVNGLGQVDVVVRDLLGREQLLSLPYLSSTRQLRAGLHDWSYEAGAVRENFGSRDDDYGRLLAAGLHRYGFSDAFTGEARLELREHGQTGGVGGSLSIPLVGVISAAGAYSHEREQAGTLGFVAWERVLRRRFSIGARATFTSPDFVQSGLTEGAQPIKRLFAANAGFSLNGYAGIGLGYVEQRSRQAVPDTEAVTANLSSRIGRLSLSLQTVTRIQPSRDQLVSLLLSMPLLNRVTGSTGYRHRENEDGSSSGQGSVRVQRNTPIGEGVGYRFAAYRDSADEQNESYSAQGAVNLNATYGSYAIEAGTFDNSDSLRGSVAGGVGYFAGHGFASRRINSGFGIVESGIADVPLLLNNQRVGHTDADGVAVIPNLQSYQSNQLRIDTGELPLDIEVATDEVTITPYYRSGLLIALPVQRIRAALLSLTTRDGRPLPAGTLVSLGERDFPVGRNGQAHVIGLVDGDNRLRARLDDGVCELRVNMPADAGIQAKLGPFACEDVIP